MMNFRGVCLCDALATIPECVSDVLCVNSACVMCTVVEILVSLVPVQCSSMLCCLLCVLVWGFSLLSCLVISAVGLVAVAIIPVMHRVIYNHMLQFLVALAIGSLTGDAVLHLLPHVCLLFTVTYLSPNSITSVLLNTCLKPGLWQYLVATQIYSRSSCEVVQNCAKIWFFRPPNFGGKGPPNFWPNFINVGHHRPIDKVWWQLAKQPRRLGAKKKKENRSKLEISGRAQRKAARGVR